MEEDDDDYYYCYYFSYYCCVARMRGNTKEDKTLIRNPKYQPKFQFFFLKVFDPILGPGIHLRGFKITLIGHTTLGRTPLDEYPSRRRDRYLTTHNSHKRHTSTNPARFEPAIPPSKQPQTHALDRAATGIGEFEISLPKIWTG